MENKKCSHQKRICMQLFEGLCKEQSVKKQEGSATGASLKVDAEPCGGSESGAESVRFVISPELRFNFHVPVDCGETLYELMTKAQQAGQMTFEVEMMELGRYLVGIDGYLADSSKRQYWEIVANGVPIPVGIDLYKPKKGQQIAFLLTTCIQDFWVTISEDGEIPVSAAHRCIIIDSEESSTQKWSFWPLNDKDRTQNTRVKFAYDKKGID